MDWAACEAAEQHPHSHWIRKKRQVAKLKVSQRFTALTDSNNSTPSAHAAAARPQVRPQHSMGLLSFIYSVLGYNLCATLFIAYLMFDYVLGALATFGARYVMESKSGGAYDFYIRWIRVDYGWTELTLTIGPITFKNPKKFKMTPFLIKIDRISCRVNPRSFLDWIKKKRPMEARTCVTKSFLGDDAAALAPLNAIEHASRRWRGDRREDSARTRRKIVISAQVSRVQGREARDRR